MPTRANVIGTAIAGCGLVALSLFNMFQVILKRWPEQSDIGLWWLASLFVGLVLMISPSWRTIPPRQH